MVSAALDADIHHGVHVYMVYEITNAYRYRVSVMTILIYNMLTADLYHSSLIYPDVVVFSGRFVWESRQKLKWQVFFFF